MKTKKKIKRTIRKNHLTKEEASKQEVARKEIEKEFPPQRFTEGYSTMDGQPCRAWFNVTNWH